MISFITFYVRLVIIKKTFSFCIYFKLIFFYKTVIIFRIPTIKKTKKVRRIILKPVLNFVFVLNINLSKRLIHQMLLKLILRLYTKVIQK